MKFLRNNWLILLESLIILGLIITTTILWIPPGKPEIIASLVSFNLNGEVKEDLQAQILIENLTTLELEVNKELILLIESDMLFLSHQIQGLERVNIYNFSYNPLPGRVNLFLENIRYRERKYLREINSIISANKDKWWYVDEFTFTPILEEDETRDKAYLYSSCGENDYLELLSIEAPFSFNDNLTLLQNETLIASWWIPDDGNWTFNDEFYQTLVVEIYSLKERIKGIEEISIPWINRNETDLIVAIIKNIAAITATAIACIVKLAIIMKLASRHKKPKNEKSIIISLDKSSAYSPFAFCDIISIVLKVS